ncbi:hypothetical protein PHYSODRAFT_392166, partial [Phytophthora sojae]
MKARCRLLVENLQPPVLKAQISQLIDLERRDCKSDGVALFDLILEHATVQQRFQRMSQGYAGREDSKSAKPEQKSQRVSTSKSGSTRSTAPIASAPPEPARTSQPTRATQPTRSPP